MRLVSDIKGGTENEVFENRELRRTVIHTPAQEQVARTHIHTQRRDDEQIHINNNDSEDNG
jgi:hypothetical protein